MQNTENGKRKVPVSYTGQAVFPYGRYGFPCELYHDNIDEFDSCTVASHWQLELEFAFVEEGTVDLFVQKECCHICENEGYLIFPNVLHSIRKSDTKSGIYKTIIVSPQFIFGDNSSILFQKYYIPVANAVPTGVILLKPDNSRSSHIMEKFYAAVRSLCSPSSAYELEVHKHLIDIWTDIYDTMQNALSKNALISAKDEELLKCIQLFIHTNYVNDISLDDIAQSANISKSECNRLLGRTLSCTPFDYLTRYRLSKSLEYLAYDNFTITEIAGKTGFNSVSYFTTVFKKHLGYTPSQYKKMQKRSFTE